MKFCKDCEFSGSSGNIIDYPKCLHPKSAVINVVNGSVNYIS